VTDLAGEKVMIDFELGKYFMLTGAANEIWDLLEDGMELGELVDELLEIFEVDRQICLSSTAEFLESLQKVGFIGVYAKSHCVTASV
jgi:hypothetical protein